MVPYIYIDNGQKFELCISLIPANTYKPALHAYHIFCVRNGKLLLIQWAKKGPKQDFGSEKDSLLKMSQFINYVLILLWFMKFENKNTVFFHESQQK